MYQLSFPCVVKYDYIGKLQTLQEDVKEVLKKAYGLTSVDDSPFRNTQMKTNKSILASFYKEIPDDQIEQLRKLYQLDFELFGYTSELPSWPKQDKKNWGSTI